MRRFLLLTAVFALSVLAFGSAQALAAKKPNTVIHGPYSKTSSSAQFHFVANKNGGLCSRCKIQCKVDSRAWRTCISSGGQGLYTFRNLSRGHHTVRARAVDRSGRKDPTPAVKGFNI
jgi:hypothetical protein